MRIPTAVALAAIAMSVIVPRAADAMSASPIATAGAVMKADAEAIIPVGDVTGHGFQPFGSGGNAGSAPSYDARRSYDGRNGYGARRPVRPQYYDEPRYYGPRYGDRPGYYDGPRSYSYPRRCREVWTDYGPRRICR